MGQDANPADSVENYPERMSGTSSLRERASKFRWISVAILVWCTTGVGVIDLWYCESGDVQDKK
jgi:hypothetical protein